MRQSAAPKLARDGFTKIYRAPIPSKSKSWLGLRRTEFRAPERIGALLIVPTPGGHLQVNRNVSVQQYR